MSVYASFLKTETKAERTQLRLEMAEAKKHAMSLEHMASDFGEDWSNISPEFTARIFAWSTAQ